MSTTIMQSLTFIIFILSEKIGTLTFLPHSDTQPAGQGKIKQATLGKVRQRMTLVWMKMKCFYIHKIITGSLYLVLLDNRVDHKYSCHKSEQTACTYSCLWFLQLNRQHVPPHVLQLRIVTYFSFPSGFADPFLTLQLNRQHVVMYFFLSYG